MPGLTEIPRVGHGRTSMPTVDFMDLNARAKNIICSLRGLVYNAPKQNKEQLLSSLQTIIDANTVLGSLNDS